MIKPDMEQDYELLIGNMMLAEFCIKNNQASRTDILTCTIEEMAEFLVKRGVTVGIKLAEYEKMQDKYRAKLRKKRAKNNALK